MFGIFLICFLLNDVSLAENQSHEPIARVARRATIEPEGKTIKRMNYYRIIVRAHTVCCACAHFLLVIFATLCEWFRKIALCLALAVRIWVCVVYGLWC